MPREDSDQPDHSCNLIRILTDTLWVAMSPKHLQADSKGHDQTVDVQADLSLRWAYMLS